MAQHAKRKRGRPVKHGLSRTRAYTRWRWLDYDHKHKRHSRKYRGHEITLCEEWRGIKGLIQFCKDMGEPPELGALIEFIDITKPASKSNCYWKRRMVELTPEEVRLTAHRLNLIRNHKHLLTRWELQTVSKVFNVLKSNAPISRRCFNKIEEIYDKVQSALSISRQAVIPPPAPTIDNLAPQKTNLERLQEFEKERKGNLPVFRQAAESPPKNTSDKALPRSQLEQLQGNLAIPGQPVNPCNRNRYARSPKDTLGKASGISKR